MLIVIPGHQQLLPLCWGEHEQFRNRLIGLGDHALHQGAKMTGQARHALGGKQVRIVLNVVDHLIVVIFHHQRHVKSGALRIVF